MKLSQSILVILINIVSYSLVHADEQMVTIKKGDTLQKISFELFGTNHRWQEILAANRDVIQDPKNLSPGTQIKITSTISSSISNGNSNGKYQKQKTNVESESVFSNSAQRDSKKSQVVNVQSGLKAPKQDNSLNRVRFPASNSKSVKYAPMPNNKNKNASINREKVNDFIF